MINKYWGITKIEKTNLLLYVYVVLDPRYKLAYVNYYFNKFLEEDCAKKRVNKVEEAFHRLCNDYYMRMSMYNHVHLSKDLAFKVKMK